MLNRLLRYLSKPQSIALLGSIFCNLLFGYIAGRHHWNLPGWTPALSGFVFFILFYLPRLSAEERSRIWQMMWEAEPIYWAITIAAAIGAAHFPAPQTPGMAAVYEAIRSHILWPIATALVLWILIQIFPSGSIGRPVAGAAHAARRILWIYAFLVSFLSALGDPFYEMINTGPPALSPALLLVLLLLVGFGCVVTLVNWLIRDSLEDRLDGHTAVARATRNPPEPGQTMDSWRTAVHETGHALCFAALGDKSPRDLSVQISANNDGAVTTTDLYDECFGVDYMTWAMLTRLAGQAAERHHYGNEGVGASSDRRRWLALADLYLSSNSQDIYYPDPNSPLQIEQNERKLETLRSAQFALLRDFFAMNDDVLMDLMVLLHEKKDLDAEALRPFFQRVRFPQAFPQPTALAEAEV